MVGCHANQTTVQALDPAEVGPESIPATAGRWSMATKGMRIEAYQVLLPASIRAADLKLQPQTQPLS